jgi:predicted ribonuclease YlaK
MRKTRASKLSDNPHQWRSPSHFKRLTANHERIIQSIHRNPVTIINGPAGSLKTFLALQTSLKLVKQGLYEKILYIRQNIQRPNEKGLGFRPGEESEKLSPLLKPIEDNLTALVPPGELDYLLKTKRIEGSDVEMIRGRSPLETILVLDEAQNADLTALETVMTRKPESSKLILLGDFKGQRDLFSREFDAFELVCEEFSRRSPFCVINLNYNDILRDPLIREIIDAFSTIRDRLKQ